MLSESEKAIVRNNFYGEMGTLLCSTSPKMDELQFHIFLYVLELMQQSPSLNFSVSTLDQEVVYEEWGDEEIILKVKEFQEKYGFLGLLGKLLYISREDISSFYEGTDNRHIGLFVRCFSV